MKLSLGTVQKKQKVKKRTHASPRNEKPLASQMRKLRRHYYRMSIIAARLQGRPQPRSGVALQIAMSAVIKQAGVSRRDAAIVLLREMAASKAGAGTGAELRASELASDVAAGEWEA